MTDPITLPPVITGEHVRAIMVRHGLSQGQMADLVGTHRVVVNRWVGGRRGLSQESAARVRVVAEHLASNDAVSTGGTT